MRLLASGARDWNRQLFDLERAVRDRSRHAVVGRQSHCRLVGARPHRAWRQFAQWRADVSIGEAQMYGGIVKGSFGVAQVDADADVEAQFQLTDVDLQPRQRTVRCQQTLRPRQPQRRAGSVRTRARSASPLARRHRQSDRPRRRDLRLQRRTVIEAAGATAAVGRRHFRNGSTPFDDAHHGGEASATAWPPRRTSGSTGQRASHADRHCLGAGARIRPQGCRQPASASAAPSFELPFVVQGPWDDPLIFPDPESLIRRSPARRRCWMP